MANLAVLSSSSSFNHRWTYDVFLSFRGEDTRFNFTGNLYHSLHRRGIHTFIDEEDLRRGEEITPTLLKAIEESRIAIIVFSKNYASSTFCLDELTKILELLKGKGHRLVWPVFYGVDPSDVRHQRGSYGEALSKHERKFENDWGKVQKWKLALREAANLSGWHFGHKVQYEHQFIETIVKEVSTRINRLPLHIAKYPVGLESSVPKIISILEVGSDDKVTMVGIYGIGGIGKTTIARAVYNCIVDQFEGVCFLADVREKSVTHGLVQLQEKVLYDLVEEKDIKLGDVNQGIMILKHRLQKKKVLLILDDVDKVEQLEQIAGGCDWFGSGSRIIITTRDTHLLGNHRVEKMYEANGLNYHESLDLFCWSAFKSNKVNPNYSEIISCMVDYAKGLPLALEIMGSNLFGKSINDWKSALDNYKRIPIRKVGEVLKVSYDGLEDDEKEIFLDIASFFKGVKLKHVMNMLKHARGFNPRYGIGVLKDKSLIKIEYGYVQMHDLIQDMGREIVRQQSPREPGERSRLWSHKDITHVLEENTGTNKVEVIILNSSVDHNVHSVHWSGMAFKKTNRLRILIINNVKFSTGPKYLPNSLRVLDWRGYPSPYLPVDFCPKELFILRLDNGRFSLLEPLLGFESLSIMNFDKSELITRIPDVSGVPNLKKMSFNYCMNLVEIHDSVGFLNKLRILRLRKCCKLRSFLRINLTALEELDLQGCSSFHLFPEVLGEMRNLTELRLSGTNMELPSSIQNVIGLQIIQMVCRGGIQLPLNIAMLPNLTSLEILCGEEFQLSKQSQGKEEGNLLTCPNIEKLVLGSCNNVTDETLSTCLSCFSNVKTLVLSSSNFTILPACIKEFHFLRELYLDYCRLLQEISGVPPNIQNLSAKNCTLLSSQSTSILLSQELHETGGKIFLMPGGRIPEWVDHCNKGGSICFWFRNKFPRIALCVVIGFDNKQSFTVIFHPIVIINGNRQFEASGSEYVLSIVADHIFVFDLQKIEFPDKYKLEEASLENEWNHVEVSYVYTILPYLNVNFNRLPFENLAKESGVYLYKGINNMEDIRFTNPYMDNEANEIPRLSPLDAVVSMSSGTATSPGQQQLENNEESIIDHNCNEVMRSNPEEWRQFSFSAFISWVVSLYSSRIAPWLSSRLWYWSVNGQISCKD